MINVDTVYQRVLAILNKEQRGYLTPQNFNLFANQVQLDTLEQYFYDLETFLNIPGNSSVHADHANILETKIAKFEENAVIVQNSGGSYLDLPTNLYRLSNVIYNNNIVQRVNRKSFRYIMSSPIAKPSDNQPVYIEHSNGINVYGEAELITNISVDYIKNPINVVWGYTNILGVAQYNASTSVNFELDPSEETDVILKILALAGLEVKDISIYEAAGRETGKEEQQELR